MARFASVQVEEAFGVGGYVPALVNRTRAAVCLASRIPPRREPPLGGRTIAPHRHTGRMTEDVFYICETCRQKIDPDAPDTVRAVELVKTVTSGPTIEYLEGMGVFFHERCYPTGSPDYRRQPEA